MSKMIFEDAKSLGCLGFHLWKDLFICCELNQIMRQKNDLNFAEMLNRIRVGVLLERNCKAKKLITDVWV